MSLYHYSVPDRCPSCDLILLSGHALDAAARVDELGPIYGISKNVTIEDCNAAYVGIDGAMQYPNFAELHRCPKCGDDPVVRVEQEVTHPPDTLRLQHDDSKLVEEYREFQQELQSLGLEAACRRCIDGGLNEQVTWKFIRSYFGVSFRDYKRIYDRLKSETK